MPVAVVVVCRLNHVRSTNPEVAVDTVQFLQATTGIPLDNIIGIGLSDLKDKVCCYAAVWLRYGTRVLTISCRIEYLAAKMVS